MFAVQDSLFWVSFIAATTLAAAIMPVSGHSPGLALAGSAIYLAGLAIHGLVGRRRAIDV